MFFDTNFVSVNGNLANVNAFNTPKGKSGAFVTIASQNGQDNQGNDRTNWIEFIAWGDKVMNAQDVYQDAHKAPKGQKKVSARGRIVSWKDRNNHNHNTLVLSRIAMVSALKKRKAHHGDRNRAKSPSSVDKDGDNGLPF